MVELYGARKPPTLGTADLSKLEEKAREAFKDNLGEIVDYSLGFYDLITRHRCLSLHEWERRNCFHISREP
jgi:hypothetical protein